MSSCPLCEQSDYTVLSYENWRIGVNDDQHFLGRCYFALDRHETDVTQLEPGELVSLWRLFAATKAALIRLFQPDHFNYVFLMNVTAHVHAHIIPRYDQPRAFLGDHFVDGRIGDHYDIGNPNLPSNTTLLALRDALRQEIKL